MRRILWFRRDLRVSNNSLLSFGGEVLPIFIFDTNILSKLKRDDRRVSYIYGLVKELKLNLQAIGLDLKIFHGNPIEIIKRLQETHTFDEVIASGDYDSYAKERDKNISHILPFRSLHDTYIFNHNEVLKDNGEPYYVFTPFYKKALKVLESKNLVNGAIASHTLIDENFNMPSLEGLGFTFVPLEIDTVEKKLQNLKNNLSNYKQERDFLGENVTSKLSLELRFGAIGVRELVREIQMLHGSEAFIRQLIFRDFYASLLLHLPSLETKNYKSTFNGIEDEEKYLKFCEAKTGVPIVDAGVRELLQSGNMHNRVRMVAASFFTKDLLLPWQWGESFFAQHLLDYDKASNVLSWQWSAGTGVDPQPYFRVFNPYLQSKKFDKEALYIKNHLPELSHIEPKNLHDEAYLLSNEIDGYPKPMLVHKEAVQVAIESFKKLL